MTVAKADDLLSRVDAVDAMTPCRLLIAAELVEDITRLDTSLKASKKRVKAAVLASGTTVTDVYGVGPNCSAMLIATSETSVGSRPRATPPPTTPPPPSKLPQEGTADTG